MNTRIKMLISVVFACSIAAVGFAEPRTVSVRVMPGGKTCLVARREAECSLVSEILLRKLGATLDDMVAVSPDGCGENARAEALAVLDHLKKLGFKNVALVSLITEPGRKCAA